MILRELTNYPTYNVCICLFLLEAAIKDNILYGIPLYTSIESNLLTVKTTEGNTIQLDFMNGKIEKVWVNGIFIPLSIEERLKITILAI